MSEKLIMTAWENNALQFARLLAELQGLVTVDVVQEAATSMDLAPSDVLEIFERADEVWTKIKSQTVGGVYQGSLRLVEDE